MIKLCCTSVQLLLVSWCSDTSWHCRSISKVHDEWFADEEAVRNSVGLLDKPVVQFSNAREVSAPSIWVLSLGLRVICCSLFFFSRYDILSCASYTGCFHLHEQLVCGICFELFPRDMITSAACGHPFCYTCWSGILPMLFIDETSWWYLNSISGSNFFWWFSRFSCITHFYN